MDILILLMASIFPLGEDCNRVIITWDNNRAMIEGYQAQEVRVGDLVTGDYIMTRGRGFAGASMIMQPVCGASNYVIEIRFAKNCVRNDPSDYWYHEDSICEWESWMPIWFSGDSNRPVPVNLVAINLRRES